jgi:GAF domain-containing protein
MYNHALFVETLSGFARQLVAPYEVDVVLGELAQRVSVVLDLVGSGVVLMQNGHLQFANAIHPAAIELEHTQQDFGSGPCVEAIRTGEVVAIDDLEEHTQRWPEYVAVAHRHGVRSVVGIPLTLVGETIGALNLYSAKPRSISAEDLLAARVFADMATAYLVNASKHDQQRQLNAQLQRALDERVIIEQAKGITANAHNTTVADAFTLIRRHARHHNASIHSVAQAIVNAGLRV